MNIRVTQANNHTKLNYMYALKKEEKKNKKNNKKKHPEMRKKRTTKTRTKI